MKKEEEDQEVKLPDMIGLRIIYQAYLFILGIIMIVLSSIGSKNMEYTLNDFDVINANWQKEVLVDVKIVNSNVQCETLGKEFELIATYEWPGTQDGCDCRNIFLSNRLLATGTKEQQTTNNTTIQWTPKKQIYAGKCNGTQINYSCSDIPKLSNRIMNIWSKSDNINNGVFVCGRRLAGYDWMRMLGMDSCSLNEKNCASNNSDHLVCVPKNEKCPISSISFQQRLDFEEGDGIYFQRIVDGVNNLPLSEFKITEGEGVCLQNKNNNISPGRQDYVLMNNLRTTCSNSNIDERFKKVNQINEKLFFALNGIDLYTKNLPEYVIDSKYNWGFYYRRYINWGKLCKGKLFESFIDQSKILSPIIGNQKGLIAICSIYFGIISFLFSILIGVNLSGKKIECIQYGKITDQANRLLVIEWILKTLFSFIAIILVFVSLSTLSEEINLFDQIIKRNCSDSQTQLSAILLKNMIEKTYKYNLGLLILLLLTAFFDLAIISKLIYGRINEKREKIKIQIERGEIPQKKSEEIQIFNVSQENSQNQEQQAKLQNNLINQPQSQMMYQNTPQPQQQPNVTYQQPFPAAYQIQPQIQQHQFPIQYLPPQQLNQQPVQYFQGGNPIQQNQGFYQPFQMQNYNYNQNQNY